jgi:ABC-2 type transport system ATP-binding protein
VGGDAITIRAADSESLAAMIADQFQFKPKVVDGLVRLELPAGHEWIPRLIEAFPDRIESITLGKPTLEDVFIHVTGHRFWNEEQMDNEPSSRRPREKAKTRRQGDKETRR